MTTTVRVELGDGGEIVMPGVRVPGGDDNADGDSIVYPCYNEITKQYHKRIQDIKNLELRSDDILLLSYPRSGTHWLFEILSALVQQKAALQEVPMSGYALLDTMADSKLKTLQDSTSPRIICSHFRLSQFSNQLPQVKPRIVYALRSPKDAMVSMYRMQNGLKAGEVAFHRDWDDYFKICGPRGGLYYGGWFQHVLAMDDFQRQYPDCHVTVVAYESLLENTEAVISNLAKSLGLEGGVTARDIAHVTRLDNMKKSIGMSHTKPLFKDNADGLVSTGQIGRWRELFTQSQSQLLDEQFHTIMKSSHLAELVKPFTLDINHKL